MATFSRITIERLAPGGLTKQVWDFMYFENYNKLIVDYYQTMTRPSTRHKFVMGEDYRRVEGRDCKIQNEADVPLPAEIAAEAKKKFVEILLKDFDVVPWSSVSKY